MFKIPTKEIIINSQSQVEFLNYTGTGTYTTIGSPHLATDGFFLRGFAQPILYGSLKAIVSTTLIKSVAGAAGNKQVATYLPNAVVGDCSSEPIIILYDALKLSPVQFQNQPLMKKYQVSATMPVNATATQVAQSFLNAINADKNAPVSATISSATLTITAKDVGVYFQVVNTLPIVGGLISGTFTVTTQPTNDLNTYNDLVNKDWAKGRYDGSFEFDRNAEYFPVYGQTYKSYRFMLKSTPFNASLLVPSQERPTVDTEFKIWIANGLTAQSTMDLIVTDANTAT